MTKEIPMLFSTPMVIAADNETKGMTRRVIKGLVIDTDSGYAFFKNHQMDIHTWKDDIIQWCPYGNIGDHIWVRESFCYAGDNHAIESLEDRWNIIHKATESGQEWEKNSEKWRWRPSIHMPKSAARIWLEVTGISVQRLQSISTQDILSEGVRYPASINGNPLFKLGENNSAWSFLSNKPSFTESELLFAHWAELWCKINGRDSWDANPWVWVVKFKKINR